MLCDTNEFIETLWPKYAAAHAAAVAALRNDAAPGASTGVSGERAAKVLFPRRRAWGFHKNWNYGKHAARRRAACLP